jgi:arabinofuranan 3-O-arabinosyltransferase
MTGTEEATASEEAVPLSLSLVIPAYNESSRLHDGMDRLHAAVMAGDIDPAATEFVVVDDGSTDDTASQASALLASYPHVRVIRLAENRGKGAAVRAGVAAASATIIAFADADMAIDPSQTPQFLRALGAAELAIGARAAAGSTVNRPSLHRSFMNRTFNGLVNTMTKVSLNDTQCGFKAFRAPAAKLLFHCSVTERFAFDVEILSLARRLGLPIAEVPVHWLRVHGSRIRPWADASTMLRDVYRAGRQGAGAPPLPALSVKLPADARPVTVFGELRPTLGVLRQDAGDFLVLCPLMSEPEIEATARLLAARSADAVVVRTVLTLEDLTAHAPLTLSWDDDVSATQP